jgi:hypothetical protein
LVLIEEKIAPFSFWNYIFLNKSIYQTKGIESDILLHELTHVKQKHTWDILFVELFLIVFWWNPILYLYKKAIQLNHEFLADREVLAHTQVPTYQQLLLQNATGNALYLTSSSTFSITKTISYDDTSHLRNCPYLAWRGLFAFNFGIDCWIFRLVFRAKS